MKITKEQLKNIVRETLTEESEYQTFFKKALEKAGKSIPQMSDDEKKSFFNKIEKAWKGRGEKKNEGNAFGAAVAKAKKDGDDSFKVDGKEYKVEEESMNEAKFNIAAKPNLFGDMIKRIIKKMPNRKYLVINGFDGEELYGTISDKPLKESVNEGASTEEKRIAMLAVRKQAKYRNVDLATAIRDQIRALEELERDAKRGKLK